jgi:hypothetical protein
MHTYIHPCMHACMDTYIHACIHTSIHACIHTYMHTCIHAYTHVNGGRGFRIHTHAHVAGTARGRHRPGVEAPKPPPQTHSLSRPHQLSRYLISICALTCEGGRTTGHCTLIHQQASSPTTHTQTANTANTTQAGPDRDSETSGRNGSNLGSTDKRINPLSRPEN